MDTVIRSVRLSGARTPLGPEIPRDRTSAAADGRVTGADGTVPPSRDTSGSDRALLEQQLRQELAAEVEHLFAAERQRARETGRKEGLRDADQQFADEMAKLQSTLRQKFASLQEQAEGAHRAALDALGARATDIAFVSICQILGTKAVSRDAVAEVVQEQLARFAADEIVSVRLHPHDLALLEDGTAASGLMGNIRLTADDSVTTGGCMVDTRMGRYDARLDVQLAKLKQIFDQARNGAVHG